MLLRFLTLLMISYINCSEVRYLAPNDVVTVEPKFRGSERFKIFCYRGEPKSMVYLWRSVVMSIDTNGGLYNKYVGTTPESVNDQYESQKSLFSLSFISSHLQLDNGILKLNAFEQSCVGIECKVDYMIKLKVIAIDIWKIQLLLAGIFLYTFADKLTKSIVFNYICGVCIGITASFVVLLYLLSKVFPRKSMMYGVLITGWTVSLYFLQMIKDNILIVLEKYRIYFIYYTIISGIVSLLICYRWGPIRDERTRNLIKWSLQAVGVVAMFFSTEYEEAAGALITVILLIYHIPKKWLSIPKRYLKRKFPPKRKLLSMEEYHIQGLKETDKSLRELRKFCMSPECDQWKTARKLRDVRRFASFVSGDDHVNDEERFSYRTLVGEESDLSWSANSNMTDFDVSPIAGNISFTDDEDEDDD